MINIFSFSSKKNLMRLCSVLLLSAMLSSCGATPADTQGTVSTEGTKITECLPTEDSSAPETDAITDEISPNVGEIQILNLTLANDEYTIKAEYTDNGITLSMIGTDVQKADSISYYITARGNTEIVNGEAWLVSATPKTQKISALSYASRKFGTSSTLSGAEVKSETGKIELTIPYPALKTTKDTCSLAFLPSVVVNGQTHSYSDTHPYTSSKYAETWLCVDKNGNVSYNGTFENRDVKNWAKPKYSDQDAVLNAAIKEKSVEEAIIAIAIAESKGATGYTLRLETLAEGNALSREGLERIMRSTKHPVMALYYDGDQTQQTRLDALEMAAECGAAAIDLPGFMFHTGSTATTHTAQNKQYWEDKGFNMSFVDESPAETPISIEAIDSQTKYIEKIHGLGSEVLVSTHGSTVYSSEQALAYAEFVAARGADIVKIVGKGQGTRDVLECITACQSFTQSQKLNGTKVSFHLSGASSAYITRVLCPTFYGSYIYFCYPELTEGQDANQLDLDMAVMAYKLRNNSPASIDQAIATLTDNIKHDQLTKLVTNYNAAPAIVGYIYATKSLMDKKWTFSDNTWKVKLRESGNTNGYTTRTHAYDPSADGAENVSATITGNYQPYVSASRQPRVGVFFGNDEQMLALTYNDSSKKIELCAIRDGWKFKASTTDPEKKDALVSTALYTSEALGLNIGTGDSITLGMSIEGESLLLYYAKGNDTLTKIAEISLDKVSKYIPETNLHAGTVAEIYMGTPSASKENTLTFSDISYDKMQ